MDGAPGPELLVARSAPAAQAGNSPGRPGGDRRRPCSKRRRTLQVAAVSETTDRSSESLPWSFFCFVLRFWNHTFTWVSERLSCRASSVLSLPTTYWHLWNSISSLYSCSAVKEVRVRLGRSRSSPFGRMISRIEPLASRTRILLQ